MGFHSLGAFGEFSLQSLAELVMFLLEFSKGYLLLV